MFKIFQKGLIHLETGQVKKDINEEKRNQVSTE